MTESIECAVIGAGVIGLAVARALAICGREVIVLEAGDAIGKETSSRNSEIIHAGIYYPPRSLKARLCVRGRGLLYDYLKVHGIEYRRCGKLIVAGDGGEIALLRGLMEKGAENGADDLKWLDGSAAAELEPALRCQAAILSPSTGIFDSHAFMLSLQGEAEKHGAVFAFMAPVSGGRVNDNGILLNAGGEAPMDLLCRTVVNSAGHGAWDVAAAMDGFPAGLIPPHHLAKGSYFYISGKAPFERLVYPAPGTASLGLHYTRDLGGQGRFGPDVEWVDEIDYTVDAARGAGFLTAISRYWPQAASRELVPGYAGVRPKIQAPGEKARDFMIQGEAEHGIPGLINLFGIESPGLTSSLAIAEKIVRMAAYE
jgi:L-2-hydroxyglutarate oxidase LhgO